MQRQQEENQKQQEAKQKLEQQDKHFLERYNDFVDTFNCLYPDLKHKYAIEKVMAGYGFYNYIHIIMKNFTTKKEKPFHLNHETNQWHIAEQYYGQFKILEPLTTKEQMDTILVNLG